MKKQALTHDQIRMWTNAVMSRYDPQRDTNPDVPVSFGEIALCQAVLNILDELEDIKSLVYSNLEAETKDPAAESEALAAMQQAWQKAQSKQEES